MGEWSYDDVKTNYRRNIWVGVWYLSQCLNSSTTLLDAFRMYNRGINDKDFLYGYALKVYNQRKKS